MHHQALDREAQEIERDEKRKRPDRGGGREAGERDGNDASGAVMDEPDMVDQVSKSQERHRRAKRSKQVERADRREGQAERPGEGGDEEADEEGLSRRRIE